MHNDWLTTYRDISVYGDIVPDRFAPAANPDAGVLLPLISERDYTIATTGDLGPVVAASLTALPPSAVFVVRLNANPIEPISVAVNLANDLAASVALTTQTLYFNASNWSAGVTVTATGVNDVNIVTGLVTVSVQVSDSSVATYSNEHYSIAAASASMILAVVDDDEAGLTLTLLSATTTYEDGAEVVGGVRVANAASHSVAVALTAIPTHDVVIELSANVSDHVSGRFTDLSGTPIIDLTFTSDNWHVAQTVLFEAVADDDVRDGMVSLTFSVSDASSASWGSDIVTDARSYRVLVADDDSATFAIIANRVALREGNATGVPDQIRYLAIYGRGNIQDGGNYITELDLFDAAGNQINYTPSIDDGECGNDSLVNLDALNDDDTVGFPFCSFGKF